MIKKVKIEKNWEGKLYTFPGYGEKTGKYTRVHSYPPFDSVFFLVDSRDEGACMVCNLPFEVKEGMEAVWEVNEGISSTLISINGHPVEFKYWAPVQLRHLHQEMGR